ncbi:111aa long hypothetical protein [Pyrococcus horikoshii OT3]|uniref:Uncharacterized protein n=1 Tax=Pyrococcus horikoshii (strain ATCC 700860 / DSM 12428 / JCM 9974 / NBRC 100139 / OT-3) TaxID=70601 RepID=O59498_PYRHO|nr:111aa long hypothetical protein [Pyrococcus horikoshii OT3]
MAPPSIMISLASFVSPLTIFTPYSFAPLLIPLAIPLNVFSSVFSGTPREKKNASGNPPIAAMSLTFIVTTFFPASSGVIKSGTSVLHTSMSDVTNNQESLNLTKPASSPKA